MPRRLRRRIRLVCLTSLLALPLISSCGDKGGGTGPTPTPVATSVTVTPATSSLTALGAQTQLSAQVRDQNGQVLGGASVTWSSSNTSVATVNASGTGTAVSVGSTTITARSGSASGTTSLNVTQVVTSVAVSPATHSLVTGGETVQLSATASDANSNLVPGATFTWSSSDPSCVQVNSNGLATSGQPGASTITATSGTATGTAQITVSPVPVASVEVAPADGTIQIGEPLQLTATTKDASGTPLAGRVVTWTSGNEAVASVDGNGLVTGVTAGGPVTITATSEGESGTAQVTVLAPVATVEVTPPASNIVEGATVQLSAVTKDAGGNILTGRTITWGSGNETIATVTGTGLVLGLSPGGPATITATSEGVPGTAQVTVIQVPVASVELAPPNASVVVGATTQLVATLKDAGGNPLTGRTITWSSGNEPVALVTGTGLVLGSSPGGPVTITATSEGVKGTAQVTVIQVPVASVTVTPANASVVVGGTIQLVATLKDALGNPLTGRAVTWASGNGAVASVGGNGLVLGVSPGCPITVTATSEGVSATARITVTQAPVATVIITPANGSIVVGNTLQLTAVLKDAKGKVLSGRVITWTSGNGAVASVNATGLVLGAVAGGPITITATSEGQSGIAQITVTQAPVVPVATVEVAPSTGLLAIGTPLTLTATLKDAAGNVLSNRSVSWTMSRVGVVAGNASSTQADLRGIGLGSVEVYAWSEGVVGTSLIRVTSPLTCATIGGGEIWAYDNQYLGRLAHQFDNQSILNQFGPYGSQYSLTSIYYPFGAYGSQFAILSAYNPFALNPPQLWIRGLNIAYVTKNTLKISRIDPDALKTCAGFWPVAGEQPEFKSSDLTLKGGSR